MAGYTHADACDSGYLQVSSLHKIYYSQYGRQGGKTVIFLHGGPGGHTSKANTAFFDPATYHVVLLDQRGAGKSTPVAETRENTTQHLIADIESLRSHLQISRWDVVFGGSWGSTLSLAYAQAHPGVVGCLVLRGIFLGTQWEAAWQFKADGAAMLFPDRYAEFVGFLPEPARADPLRAYHDILTGDDEERKKEAGRAWNRWELAHSTLRLADDAYASLDDETWNAQHSVLEAHYFVNDNFLNGAKELLQDENVKRIKDIPMYIVHGRYDTVCPPKAAWALHTALPQSELYFVDDAGHSVLEPGTEKKLIEICDKLGGQASPV